MGDQPVERRSVTGSAPKLLFLYERWRSGLSDAEATVVLPLGWSKGDSVLFTRARGVVSLDYGARTLALEVSGLGLEALAGHAELEVWLHGSVPRAGRNDASNLAPVFRLGEVPIEAGAGSAEFPLRSDMRAFDLERIRLAQVGSGAEGGGVLFAAPDLFQRMYALERSGTRPLHGSELGGLPLASAPHARRSDARPSWTSDRLEGLVAAGERLFFEETFEGNGRTCGTCHPAENNFTLDPGFIAGLPPEDPLFVAETVAALDSTRNGGFVFESPTHMRRFGLIVENLDGFDNLRTGFVLRAVQPTLGLAATIEPQTSLNQPLRHLTGWGGDGSPGRGSLGEFATGAVVQHFPKSLDRLAGRDFRLPRPEELTALEAFQLSLGRTEDPDLARLTFGDARARRGRNTFLVAGACNSCHINGGGNTVTGLSAQLGAFLGTGVEALEQASPDGTGLVRPVDGGFGTTPAGEFGVLEPLATGGFGNGRFSVPSLIEFADTLPAFHSHLTVNPSAGLANTVEGAVSFYNTQAFTDSDAGGGIFVLDLSDQEVADIGSFLRALNALENLRTVGEYVERALVEVGSPRFAPVVRDGDRLLSLARNETEDALSVLEEGSLYPETRQQLVELEGYLLAARRGSTADRRALLQASLELLVRARAGIAIEGD